MSDSATPKAVMDSTSEIFRLCLLQLGKLKLPITPVNYALIYFYISGDDLDLNDQLQPLIDDPSQWNSERASELFDRYICIQASSEANKKMREELLSTVANILGMLIDLAGKTAMSNGALEKHMENLASTREPEQILHIAADIISETRHFVDETKMFESSLADSTQEIQILKSELDDARRQATRDPLTGLNNRRGFNKALESISRTSQQDKSTFCFLLIDIDHFKKINDTYGHLVGDKVLVGLSSVLSKHVRGGDYLARYGGEEFAIIMPETLITGAFTVAENLRKSIERLRLKHVKTGEHIGQVTISIGVACSRADESVQDMIERCDKALYRAKSLGRNRTVIAD